MLTGTINLDVLLSFLSRAAWLLFAVYAVISFVGWVRSYGIGIAVIRLFSVRVLGPLLLVIAIALLSLAVVFVYPQQVGVVVSLLSPGGVRPQPVPGGLHWVVPVFEEVALYPIFWQTYTMSSKPLEGQEVGDDSIRARTSDGQEVFLDCSAIFRIDANQAVLIHIDWQDRYIQDLVRPVVRGFVRTQVSQFTVDEVNSSSRKDLEATLDQLLREEFRDKGLILDQFLLRDITFSPEYALSVEEKQVALQGQIRTEYEAQQIRNLARGRADAVEIEAEAQKNALLLIAEALTQEPRLLTYEYIDKLSPNIQALLLPSNAPLILPLPDLLETAMPTPTPPITATVPPPPLSGVQ